MPISARLRAEKLFATEVSRADQLRDDKKRAQVERAEQVVRLRERRLAKERADAGKKAARHAKVSERSTS